MEARSGGRGSHSGLSAKRIVGGIGALILVVLVVANFDDVTIDLIVGDFTLPLAVVIIGAGLLGALAGWAMRSRR